MYYRKTKVNNLYFGGYSMKSIKLVIALSALVLGVSPIQAMHRLRSLVPALKQVRTLTQRTGMKQATHVADAVTAAGVATAATAYTFWPEKKVVVSQQPKQLALPLAPATKQRMPEAMAHDGILDDSDECEAEAEVEVIQVIPANETPVAEPIQAEEAAAAEVQAQEATTESSAQEAEKISSEKVVAEPAQAEEAVIAQPQPEESSVESSTPTESTLPEIKKVSVQATVAPAQAEEAIIAQAQPEEVIVEESTPAVEQPKAQASECATENDERQAHAATDHHDSHGQIARTPKTVVVVPQEITQSLALAPIVVAPTVEPKQAAAAQQPTSSNALKRLGNAIESSLTGLGYKLAEVQPKASNKLYALAQWVVNKTEADGSMQPRTGTKIFIWVKDTLIGIPVNFCKETLHSLWKEGRIAPLNKTETAWLLVSTGATVTGLAILLLSK